MVVARVFAPSLFRRLRGVAALALLFLAACTHGKGARVEDPGLLPAEERARLMEKLIPQGADPKRVTLGPGDEIEIRVYNEPELSGRFSIAQEGTIDFPLVGTVTASQLTTAQLAEMLRERLAEGGVLREPNVTVFIVKATSQKVFILGQVEKPNAYIYEAGMTIVQLISMAGGFKLNASRNATTVIRVVDGREVRIVVPVEDISTGRAGNFTLLPNDIVNVPDNWL